MKGKKILKALKITIAIFVISLVAVVLLFFTPIVDVPSFKKLDKRAFENITKTVSITSDDGLDNINLSKNNAKYVSISSLPSYVPLAFISTEDKRFYQHFGVDLKRILSSIRTDIVEGGFKEGASTITQQLVKNTHLTQDKTIKRKLNEIRLAIDVERNYAKNEILEMYLNSLYFGYNVYGIDNASLLYFDKHAEYLSLEESAVLVAIINNPTYYNPYNNLDNCIKRRNLVLKRMKEQGYISQSEYEKAIEKEIKLYNKDITLNHYYTAVFSECETLGIDPNYSNVKIISNMDAKLQENVEKIIENTNKVGFLTILIGENQTGKIKAFASNYPYDVSNSRFLPGSTIKPVLCYAPLIEKGEIYICSPVKDEKYEIEGYAPSNYSDKYLGNITQQDSLAYSSNSVSLKNIEKIGLKNAVDFAQKSGLNFDKSDYKNYSTALGGVKYGFTLKELLTSYMTFARLGSKIEPKFIDSVYQNNKCVYVSNNIENQVMKDSTAFLTTQMLKACTSYGTARTLNSFSNVASKTGTVGDDTGNDICYCISYTPKFTILCCVSKNDKKLPLNITGGTTPTRVMKEVLVLLNDKSDFKVPNSVTKEDVDLCSLKNFEVLLANSNTLEKNKKSYYFSKTNVPKKYNSFDDFIKKYNLFYDNHFSFFNSFVN